MVVKLQSINGHFFINLAAETQQSIVDKSASPTRQSFPFGGNSHQLQSVISDTLMLAGIDNSQFVVKFRQFDGNWRPVRPSTQPIVQKSESISTEQQPADDFSDPEDAEGFQLWRATQRAVDQGVHTPNSRYFLRLNDNNGPDSTIEFDPTNNIEVLVIVISLQNSFYFDQLNTGLQPFINRYHPGGSTDNGHKPPTPKQISGWIATAADVLQEELSGGDNQDTSILDIRFRDRIGFSPLYPNNINDLTSRIRRKVMVNIDHWYTHQANGYTPARSTKKRKKATTTQWTR